MKTFITGPSASGKTTLAKKIAEESGREYVDYDKRYTYVGANSMVCERFLHNLPTDCVIDNIPQDNHPDRYPTWWSFWKWGEQQNDIEVICAVLGLEEWLSRKPAGIHKLTKDLWNAFWVELFPTARFSMRYVKTSKSETYGELSHADAMSLIRMRDLVSEHVWNLKGTYDMQYQDVPEIGIRGYINPGSGHTWNNIKNMEDWKNVAVADCGTFHGFFLFRIKDAGNSTGRLYGLDHNEHAIKTARAINMLRGDDVEFRMWRASTPDKIPEADVTICLNALHWFPNVEWFFGQVKSPVTIFEVGEEYEDIIRKHWKSVEVFRSSRPPQQRRKIFRCMR